MASVYIPFDEVLEYYTTDIPGEVFFRFFGLLHLTLSRVKDVLFSTVSAKPGSARRRLPTKSTTLQTPSALISNSVKLMLLNCSEYSPSREAGKSKADAPRRSQRSKRPSAEALEALVSSPRQHVRI
ncbi:hypothetical protein P5673_025088 [Acropora cervicornis]|uniref:Uncharacterized protein n=1 Tax=Acropora cervicornis TaxID=6130 RepID=A0AAD9Q3C6_ACRCE|nr:hypothetical protein P5673_025088 [Acropora cervicornis]